MVNRRGNSGFEDRCYLERKTEVVLGVRMCYRLCSGSFVDSVMVPLCLYLIGKCTLDKTVRVEYKSR